MSGTELRTARERLGLTQQQAARRWRVSQAYVSLMERGRRPVPTRLAQRLARRDRSLTTALPVHMPVAADDLPRALGNLGYPGFAYLADARTMANPATVVLAALAQGMPARVTEAVPWVLATFSQLDWRWLVDQAKVANVQNRLGYLVVLARMVADQRHDRTAVRALSEVEAWLEDAKLVREDTLGRSVTDAERRYLRSARPADAARWNLLTTLRVEDLRYEE
jgi:transcriptional regulator with XRE-family HTH domain